MIKFRSDKYRKARGGYSRFLDIICLKCGNHLFFYQKDGPGILKRLYKDRILEFSSKEEKLICSNCKTLLATSYIYEKENRPAYKLIEGTVRKKIIKSQKVS